MSKYKISVSFDKQNYFWIVTDTRFDPMRLIRNPTEDDLKDAISKGYNNTNICDRCRDKIRCRIFLR